MRKARTAVASSASAFIKSPTAVEFFWWHFALIVPTIAFKYLFLRRMSFTTGLWTILDSMGDGIERYVNLFLLASVDILEVSIIVGALFVAGHFLLRIPVRALMFASVFLCLMIMGANQYSLLLVANLVSADTLAISVNWAKEHPHVFWQSISLIQIGFIALAVAWSSYFAALPTRRTQNHFFPLAITHNSYSFLLTVIFIGSALGCLALSRIRSDFPLVLRGYWSSTAIAFFQLDTPKLPSFPPPRLATIQADYQRLVYPLGVESQPDWLAAIPTNRLSPRHILVIMLETAPRRYYPLIDNPKLPVFYQMSQRAIVSNHHYAMSPYTSWNTASIMSGNYFVQKGKGIFDYGKFVPDSIATILRGHGYSATFIDSFKLGWGGTTGFWRNFGFTHFHDAESESMPFDRTSYSLTAANERHAFLRALKAITDAERQRKKAVVMLATTIGHYPWLAKPGDDGRSNEDKLFAITALFDDLLGDLLKSLKQHRLGDRVLIVVTGDHGFRMRTEFESVGLKAEHGDVAFNVPFVLFAPGIFDKQVRLPYVTSHVDIAPTLLALTGLKQDSWLHHGTHVLDQRLRDRVTFMMNTNLSPVSGFRWHGCHYTLNDFTGQVQVANGGSRSTQDSKSESTLSCDSDRNKLTDDVVRSMLKTAERQFQTAFAYFQQRKAPGTN